MAEQQPVQVIITGFGSFHGVPSNPTERIVGWLQRQFAVGEGGDSPPAQSLRHGHIHSCTILKVSARAVNDYLIKQLEDLKQRSLEACNGATAAAQTGGGGRDACAAPVVLLLHFGVDVHRPWFNLETRAVNNATFRAPDEDGWQPDRHPITTAPGTSLGCAVCTDLDLARLQRRLRGSRHDVRLSTDAGKFVCNWTYYNSLALCREAMAAGAAAAVTAAAATAAAAPTAADTAMPDVAEPSGGGGGTSASGSGSDGSSSSSCSSSGGGGGSSDAVSDAHGGAAGSSSPLRASAPSAPLAAAAPAAPPSGCGGGGGRFGALAVHSLFVHVPSFSAISEDRQLRFAVNLIEALCEQLYHHHLAKSSGGAAGGGNGQAQRQRQHQHRQRSHGRGHNGPQSRGHSSGSRHGGGAGGGAGGGSHSSHQTSQQYQQEHPQHHHQHQQQQQHQQPLQQQQHQQPWAAEPHWHHQHEFGGLAVSGIHHQHVSA